MGSSALIPVRTAGPIALAAFVLRAMAAYRPAMDEAVGYRTLCITTAVDGHALAYSTDVWTDSGTAARSISLNPKPGK